MKKLILCALLVSCGAAYCAADATTLRMGLTKPTTSFGDVWGYKYNNTMDIIDSSSAVQAQSNTFTSSNTFTGSRSTVTVNQDLILGYTSANACLATDGNKDVISQACGGSGTSALGIYNNGVLISSPTSALNFSSNFTVTLQGSSTAQIDVTSTSLNVTTATVHAVFFNGSAANPRMQVSDVGTHSLLRTQAGCLWMGYDTGSGSSCQAGGVNDTAVGSGALATCNSDGNNNCHEATAYGVNSQAANVGGFEDDAFGFDTELNLTTGLDNEAFGAYSLRGVTTGGANAAFGFSASTAVTTGSDNVAVGFAALEKNTGSNSTAVGFSALGTQSVGPNAAFGFDAGSGLTTGNFNNIFGNRSMGVATTAVSNSCMGDASCFALVSGYSNTMMGANAFESAQTVSSSTCMGASCLVNNTGGVNDAFGYNSGAGIGTGTENVCVGYQSCYGVDGSSKVTTGSQNVFIGFEAAPSTAAQLTNAIGIGSLSTVLSSNTAVIGQYSGTNEVNLMVSSITLNRGIVIGNGIKAATATLTGIGTGPVQTDSTGKLYAGVLTSTSIPSDVAYIDVANTFTSSQTFKSSSTFSGAIVQSGSAGTSGQLLQSNGAGSAPSWTSAPSTNKLIQTHTCTTTSAFTVNNSTFQITNLSCTITPTSSSNDILVMAMGALSTQAGNTADAWATIYRGNATDLGGSANDGLAICDAAIAGVAYCPTTMIVLDAPATTSATTYHAMIRNDASANVGFGTGTQLQVMILQEVTP